MTRNVDDQATYSTLEHDDLVIGQSVRFCNDRDKVDFGVQTLHELDINRLQPVTHRQLLSAAKASHSRVSSRLDEVDASVYTIIHELVPVQTVLLLEV